MNARPGRPRPLEYFAVFGAVKRDLLHHDQTRLETADSLGPNEIAGIEETVEAGLDTVQRPRTELLPLIGRYAKHRLFPTSDGIRRGDSCPG